MTYHSQGKHDMNLVSRFVAEAIAENAYDDDIISDNDESIEVRVVPSKLDMDAIKGYVAHQHGNDDAAQADIDDSFKNISLSSNEQITICWEA